MSSGRYRLTTGFRIRRRLPRPHHAFQNLMSGAERRLAAILQHENLVDLRQDAGAVGQHDDDGASRLTIISCTPADFAAATIAAGVAAGSKREMLPAIEPSKSSTVCGRYPTKLPFVASGH